MWPPSTAFLYGPDDWYDFGDVIQFMGDANRTVLGDGVAALLGSALPEAGSREAVLLSPPGPSGTVALVGSSCSDDDLLIHRDGVFEVGIAWRTGGVRPPYAGAFGEAFDVAPGVAAPGSRLAMVR